MRAYLDSSSFAKRFIEEDGSDRAEDLCAQITELGLSVICVPEIVSALTRRKRERTLTSNQYADAKQRLSEDVRDADIINLTPTVIGLSIRILEKSPIRAMDALHVACALEWGAKLFASSDDRQLRAARRAGLKVRKI